MTRTICSAESTHNGFNYGFQYDAFGNNTNIAVAGNTLVSNAYASYNGKLLSTAYANGYTVEPVYNAKEQVIAQKWNGAAV